MRIRQHSEGIGAALLLIIVMSTVVMAARAEPQRAKEFVVMGYQGLLIELTSQRGPYLNTLLDLLGVDPAQQISAIDELKGFSRTYPNIMDFADHVVNRFSSEMNAAPPMVAPVPPSVPLLEPLPTGPKVFAGDSLVNALQHLGKGMRVTVFLKAGGRTSGIVNEYDARRLWIRTPDVQSFKLNEIRAIEAPDL